MGCACNKRRRKTYTAYGTNVRKSQETPYAEPSGEAESKEKPAGKRKR